MRKLVSYTAIICILFLSINSVFAQQTVNTSVLKKKGFDAYKAGKYKSAITYLNEIPKEEHTLEIVLCIANSYESLGDTRSAVFLLESLNRYNTNNYSAFYNLGNIYLKAKLYSDAINSYKTCIRLNSKFDSAYYNLGVTYSKLRDYNNALFYYEKAIRLNHNNKDAYYNAAVCHEALGHTKDAEKYFELAK